VAARNGARCLRAALGEGRIGRGTLRAVAFFVNRSHPNYAGKLPLETVIKALVSARGQLGTPAEYLLETVHGLIEHGVRDPYLPRAAQARPRRSPRARPFAHAYADIALTA